MPQLDLLFEAGEVAHLSLCLLGVVPEGGYRSLLLQFVYIGTLIGDVKDGPG
jgi:hypothetical protein